MNRIFIPYKIDSGNKIELLDQKNYLCNVLRLVEKSQILVFNGLDGEYFAEINNIKKNSVLVNILKENRKQEFLKELNVYISIIKQDRMLDSIDFAIQLGATKITPIVTDRTQYKNINYDKIEKRIIESTEQCNRLDKALLNKTKTLISLVSDQDHQVIWANESEEKQNMNNISQLSIINSILIGPEGGFSEREKKLMLDNNNFHFISLGKNILRAETALACCISQMNLLKQYDQRI